MHLSSIQIKSSLYFAAKHLERRSLDRRKKARGWMAMANWNHSTTAHSPNKGIVLFDSFVYSFNFWLRGLGMCCALCSLLLLSIAMTLRVYRPPEWLPPALLPRDTWFPPARESLQVREWGKRGEVSECSKAFVKEGICLNSLCAVILSLL
jgi:hypothetical protein